MKKKRLMMILKIIEENDVSTQEDLQDLLVKNGFDVTQATISRDIRELNLVKSTRNGQYCYTCASESSELNQNNSSIMSNTILAVKRAQNMICVKCKTGMAQAVCFAIDEADSDHIIGTIAGDDTIFIMCEDEFNAISAKESIEKMIGLK